MIGTCHPSIHPSVHPSVRGAHAPARQSVGRLVGGLLDNWRTVRTPELKKNVKMLPKGNTLSGGGGSFEFFLLLPV